MFFIILYAAATVAFFLLLKTRAAKWELEMSDVIGLAVLWPVFVLMFVDWGFGDLVDKAEGAIFHRS